MKPKTKKKTRKAFQLHAAIQRQLRRVKVDPGKTPAQTAANLKAFVDTLLEMMQRPSAPAVPVRSVPVVDERRIQATQFFVTQPEPDPEPAPEAPAAEPDFSDWRSILGIAHGANVSPITLKAALQTNLTKPGALFAYQLAKAELGIL